MKLEDDKGPIEAESQSLVSKDDEFTKDFERPMYFDVEEFEFDVGIEDDDDSDSSSSSSSTSSSSSSSSSSRTGSGNTSAKKDDKKKKGKSRFARWLGSQRNLKTDPYPVDMQPFEFTRQFDWASPLLFQLCANSTSLKSATLVQRKAGGLQNTDSINPCFLRIDFTGVLLIDVSWDISDSIIKEKIKFICQQIQVQYRVQNEAGEMYATISGNWQADSKVK